MERTQGFIYFDICPAAETKHILKLRTVNYTSKQAQKILGFNQFLDWLDNWNLVAELSVLYLMHCYINDHGDTLQSSDIKEMTIYEYILCTIN